MHWPDDQMPYRVATNVFKQGVECDNAAWLIRQRLPKLLAEIARAVKERLGAEYMPEKEQDWLKHLSHGKAGDDGPCPCLGTDEQRFCARQDCSFCMEAQRKQDESEEA